MVRTVNEVNDWQELALAAIELGQLTGVEVRVGLSLTRDVMCCKVAGNTVEITRTELEEKNFVGLYDALKAAMTRAGIEEPEQFLVPVTELAAQSELERQYALTRRALSDNQYNNQFRYLPLAVVKNDSEAFYQNPVPEPAQPATWREPRETPELELDATAKLAAPEPGAPDLILEEEDHAKVTVPNRAS